MIDTAPGFIWPWFRPFLGSALCMSDFDESGVGTTCFPSAVPELRTSTLKQTVFILTRLRSRPLVFGMSFSCLPSLLERLHLQPALSPPLSPKNLNYLSPVDRRRWNTIARHHSSPIGVSRSRS